MWRRRLIPHADQKGAGGATRATRAWASHWLSGVLGVMLLAPVPAWATIAPGILESREFGDQLVACTTILRTTRIGRVIFPTLDDPRHLIRVYRQPPGTPSQYTPLGPFIPRGPRIPAIIRWQPAPNYVYEDGVRADACMGLLHELVHGFRFASGTFSTRVIAGRPNIYEDEIYTTQVENSARKDRGLPRRKRYGPVIIIEDELPPELGGGPRRSPPSATARRRSTERGGQTSPHPRAHPVLL
jgi:hypothetical protein